MKPYSTIQSPEAIILIAAQFDELEVVTLYTTLRRHHMSIKLVSVLPGLVKGVNGIVVHPDSHLSASFDLMSSRQQLVVLAGGEACAAHILSDPRTHHLVKTVLQQDGMLAVMTDAEMFVRETGLYHVEWARRILKQCELETAVFAKQIIQRLVKIAV